MRAQTTTLTTCNNKAHIHFGSPAFRFADFLLAVKDRAEDISSSNVSKADYLLHLEKALFMAAETISMFQKFTKLSEADNATAKNLSLGKDHWLAATDTHCKELSASSAFCPKSFMDCLQSQAEKISCCQCKDEIKLERLKSLFCGAAALLGELS